MSGIGRPADTRLGRDFAGVVEAVGPDVQGFSPGDAVFYAGSIARPGTNSEFHLVDERTGNVLARLYPQDKTQNASGLRRSLSQKNAASASRGRITRSLPSRTRSGALLSRLATVTNTGNSASFASATGKYR